MQRGRIEGPNFTTLSAKPFLIRLGLLNFNVWISGCTIDEFLSFIATNDKLVVSVASGRTPPGVCWELPTVGTKQPSSPWRSLRLLLYLITSKGIFHYMFNMAVCTGSSTWIWYLLYQTRWRAKLFVFNFATLSNQLWALREFSFFGQAQMCASLLSGSFRSGKNCHELRNWLQRFLQKMYTLFRGSMKQ